MKSLGELEGLSREQTPLELKTSGEVVLFPC